MFQFSADIGHIYPKDLVVGVHVGAPDGFDQVRIGQYLAGILCQKGQQLIFDLGQMNFLPCQSDKAFVEVYFQLQCFVFAVLYGEVSAAQGGPNAGHQLRRSEGLRQIVVSAQVQRLHLVLLLGAGGDDDNGQTAPATNGGDHL